MERSAKKKRSQVMIFLPIVMITLFSFFFWGIPYAFREQGYYPLKQVLSQQGFQTQSSVEFYQPETNIQLSIDQTKETLSKNGYEFNLEGETLSFLGQTYISQKTIESIFNQTITPNWFGFSLKEKTFTPHEWVTAFPKLVAHAGGAYREKSDNTFYTNSLEALKQNYSLGHRVFEFDFELTSDNQLAVVHDWEQFGRLDGIPMSSTDWKNFKTFGAPITDSRFTTMLIGDLLDQMMINKDLFIVTDTKIITVSDEMKQEFELIYQEAMARDPELLKRIIPQIYNEEMYSFIKSIYDFPSIIYTLYATPSTPEEVIAFVSDKTDIKVVTAPIVHAITDPIYIQQLHQQNKVLYIHTIHSYKELTENATKGVDGFYTGLLLPQDYRLYHKQDE